MAKLEFDDKGTNSKQAIVVSFDLEGFSDYCNHPDAHVGIPRLISALFKEVNTFFMGRFQAFAASGRSDRGKLDQPDFIKFTGDGAIMIWLSEHEEGFTEQFCTDLVAAMHELKSQIEKKLPLWEEQWRARGLPKHARFGISLGPIYPLTLTKNNTLFDEEIDYAGYCVNLAVRLQDHCRELGFLVHGILHPKIKTLVPLLAIRIKGSRDEPVFAYQKILRLVPEKVFKVKFQAH